jgi:glycosyltransferase involved in cell wall biosynthesis
MPWPPDDGGRIVMWQSLPPIARRYATTLVTLAPNADMATPVPAAVLALGIQVVRVPHRPSPWALMQGAVGRWPYTLARFRSRRLDGVLADLARRERPRFALIHHLHLAPSIEALQGVPAVLREHNVESVWLERYAASLKNPASRGYARHQARRMRDTEAERVARADLVLAIQEEECRELRRMAPEARVEVLPVGVEPGRFLPRAPEQPPIVLLTGSLGWEANARGARRFLQEGWPEVRARIPTARLRLVGKGLTAGLADAARDAGAEIVGYVDAIEPEFARASALVVPLWIGAGARVKIVEALAAGLPVASTPRAAEGLDLVAGEHLCVSDDASGLGRAVADLLERPAYAHALATAGRRFVDAHFDLRQVEDRLLELCGAVRRAGDPLAAR